MALLSVDDVTGGVAALMDDPSRSSIDTDYVLPFINLRWSTITSQLTMLGLQNQEMAAVFTVPAGTTDLSQFQLPTQPLASMLRPLSIDWKNVGDPDTSYVSSDPMPELDDVDVGSLGILEYAWIGGTITITPSANDQVVRVRFSAMTTTLVDPTTATMVGIGEVLSFKVAEIIYAIRGNAALQKTMKDFGDEALDTFMAAETMRRQSEPMSFPPTHRRGFRSGISFTMPPGSNF